MRGARACGQRLALAVFARQKPLRQRREGHDADAVFGADLHDLVLDVAVHHVILRLDDAQRPQVQFFDGGKRLADLYGRPFADAVVEDLALLHHVGEHLHGLFDGGRGVEAVAKIHIEVVQLHIFQGIVQLFHDVLARKPPVVGARPHGEKHLGRHDVRAALVVAQHAAEEALRLAAAVCVGAVEKVDARVVGGADALARRFGGAQAVQVGHPAADGDLADFQAPFAEISVLHKMIASLSFFIIISPRRAKVNSCAENFSEEKRSSCVCVLRGGQNFSECRLLSAPNGFWLLF